MSTEERVAKLEEWRRGHETDYKELVTELRDVNRTVTKLDYDLHNGLIDDKVDAVLARREVIANRMVKSMSRRRDWIMAGVGGLLLLAELISGVI